MTKTDFRFHPLKQIKRLLLRTVGLLIPSDIFANRFPVSVKGICIIGDQVVLLKNELGQWDLPGGKLKTGESPELAVCRELKEELNIDVTTVDLRDVFSISIRRRINVLVVLYTCAFQAEVADLRMSYENFGLGLFSKDQLAGLDIHPAYLKHLLASL